jgi:hypothetical protein
MDRPHIIYCEKTGKYAAWLKIMAGLTSQFMCIMQADTFLGPYSFVHKIYKPLKMDTGDFDLAFDPETKKAYVIFDRPHFEVVTATLTDDYLGVSGEYSSHYQDRLPPRSREAPAHFLRNGKHYLFTSGVTGYLPNPSLVSVFTDYHGEYIDLGNPHIGDLTNTSFSSQITGVLKIPDRDLYIACADRWKPGRFNTWKAQTFHKFVENAMRGEKAGSMTKPDYSEKEAAPLPGKKKRHFHNTRKSNYVWLPIEWQDDKPVIRWRDKWRLEDFKNRETN